MEEIVCGIYVQSSFIVLLNFEVLVLGDFVLLYLEYDVGIVVLCVELIECY